MAPLLNIDVGELEPEPDELYACAHLVNVACGGPAGDEVSMDHAVGRAAHFGARVGAHPAFPDREGFGRVALNVTPSEARVFVRDQCARLFARAAIVGVRVGHAKPHGALYHAADADAGLATAVVRGAVDAL